VNKLVQGTVHKPFKNVQLMKVKCQDQMRQSLRGGAFAEQKYRFETEKQFIWTKVEIA